MTDDEMRAMPIPMLQDEGILFLWVTGRAMEIGRECLRVWGYTRVDEVVWVKTNQVSRFSACLRAAHFRTRYANSSNVSSARAEPVTGSIILKNTCSSA
jgi:N6-adenosine-specific RNA methylase IME4